MEAFRRLERRRLHEELYIANCSLLRLPRKSRRAQKGYVKQLELLASQCIDGPETRTALSKPTRIWLSTPTVRTFTAPRPGSAQHDKMWTDRIVPLNFLPLLRQAAVQPGEPIHINWVRSVAQDCTWIPQYRWVLGYMA